MKNRFQINKILLTSKMKLKGVSNNDVAEAIGMSAALFCMKLNGSSRFKDYQIAAIRDFLDLTSDEVMEIFYTGVVLTNDGIKIVSILHELNLYVQIVTKGGRLESKGVIDQVITGYVIQGFVTQWVENPKQSKFVFPVNPIDMAQKYKFFALNDLLVHKFSATNRTDTYSKLFESITIDLSRKTITLIIDNEKLRSL